MLNCSKCGKSDIKAIAGCELIRTGLCQFQTTTKSYAGSRRQGWLIISLSVIFIFLIIIFPVIPDSMIGSSAFLALLYSIVLGLLLFAGIAGIVIGVLMLYARQIVSISEINGQSYQESIIWTRSYRTRLIQALDDRKIITDTLFTMPASLVALGDPKLVTDLKHNNQVEYNKLASSVLLAAILDLLNRGLVVVKNAQIYQSDGQQIEHTKDIHDLLFFNSESSQNNLVNIGQLEKKILEIISNWRTSNNWLDCPLAPRITDLILSITGQSTFHSETILDLVLTDPILRQGDFLIEARLDNLSKLNSVIAKNQRIYNELELHTLGIFQSKEVARKIKKSLALSNPLFSRYVRNGLLVGIIVLFTSGRWLLGVDLLTNAGQNFVKEHHISERSDRMLAASKQQAQSKFWLTLNWLDRKWAELEMWLDAHRDSSAIFKDKVRQIKELLASGDKTAKEQATQMIEAMRGRSAELLELFRLLINDADQATRQAALEVLKEHTDVGAELIPDMVDLLGSDQLTADLSAENLMGLSEKKGLELEQSLNQALKQQNIDIQKGAEKLIKDLGL